MSNKITTVFLVLMIGSTMLLCLCYLAIFISPDIPLNPYPPVAATARVESTLIAKALRNLPPTPTSTGRYPPTWTPTTTSSPTWTLTPTETRTPTPTWTVSATKTPRPTKTTTPKHTATTTGTAEPTDTAQPPLYKVMNTNGEPNCLVMRIKGKVTDSDSIPIAGVEMQVGEMNVAGSVFKTTTDANGRYIHDFGAPASRVQRWFVIPLEDGKEAANKRYTFQTDSVDQCELNDAIQIMTVDWKRQR
ncbi:MAG: hypothetical protein B6242_00705 [Anaerolineaceae bacterium 4572_78]|nr:MAG: hypothetical protein B6242_00705 [Anaerolineaceae bacterium 4572_78]